MNTITIIAILAAILVAAIAFALGSRRGRRKAEDATHLLVQGYSAQAHGAERTAAGLESSLREANLRVQNAEAQIAADKATIADLAVRAADAEEIVKAREAADAALEAEAAEWEEGEESDPAVKAYLDAHDRPVVWPVPADVAAKTMGLRSGIVTAWAEELGDVTLEDGRIDLVGLLAKRMAARCPEDFDGTGISVH